MKSIGRYILSLLFVVSVLFGCEKQPVEQVRLEIDRTNMKMTVGQTQKLNAELKGAEGDFIWESDAPAVAEVDADGLVVALSAGKANIAVTSQGLTKVCAVEVVDFTAAKLELNDAFTKDDANNYSYLALKGDCLKLNPKFYNADGEKVNEMAYPKYAVTLSNPSHSGETVVTVDDEGVVQALNPGYATVKISGAGQVALVNLTVKSLELSYSQMTMFVNQSNFLVATVFPEDLSETEKMVEWTSFSSDYVKVNAKGVVTAVKQTIEPVVVAAQCGDLTEQCYVTVADYKIDEIVLSNLEGLKAADGTYQMLVGDNPYDLGVGYKKDGEDVTSQVKELAVTVGYSSSNTEVATIENGILSVKNAGTTEISVNCAGATTAFTLNVIQSVESVKITSPESNPYVIGNDVKAFTIQYAVYPENASVKTATFSSNAPDVATVNAKTGEVTVHKSGDAQITVTTDGMMRPYLNHNGEKVVEPATVTLVLVVSDEASKPSVEIKGEGVKDGNLTIKKGNKVQLSAAITPATYTGTVSWSTTTSNILSVDSNTGLLTALARGNGKVVAVAGGAVAELAVNVLGIDPTAIKIDQEFTEAISVSEKQLLLSASVTAPDNGDFGGVNWYSSDDAIATVNAEGNLSIHKAGSVTITAKALSADGSRELSNVTASINLTFVAPPVNEVMVTLPNSKLEVGATMQLGYQLIPSEAEVTNVSWTIVEGSEYASITGNGVVTGLVAEKVTDPVTNVSSWKTATVKVTVDGVSATAEVTVIPEQPKDIQCTLPDRPLKVGEPWNLNPKCIPESLGYEVTPGFQAPVTDGVFLSYSPGRNDFMMYISDGYENLLISFHRNFSITVEPYWVTGLSIPETLSLAPDSFATLDVAFTSDGGAGVAPSDKSVIWTSSDQSVVTVDSKTGEITAHAPGKATVTVTTCGQWSVPSGSPHLSASCEVTVKKAEMSVNVGDYYYSDGTWSSDLKADKTVVGIVFSAANAVASDAVLAADHPDCSHGLVMGLSELTDVQFYTGNASMKTTHRWLMENGYKTDNESYVCGYGNTKGYEALNAAAPSGAMPVTVCDKLADYPAAAPSASSGWYVPSYKEMYLIGQQMAKLNESLTAAGGTVLREIHKYVEFDEFSGKDVERSVHQQYWHSTYQYLWDNIYTKGFNMQSKGWHSVITIATSKWPVRVVLAF